MRNWELPAFLSAVATGLSIGLHTRSALVGVVGFSGMAFVRSLVGLVIERGES